MYQKEEIKIDLSILTDETGNWLLKPFLCRSLKTKYKETLNKIYKGHIEIGDCSFFDREENVIYDTFKKLFKNQHPIYLEITKR